MVCRYSDQELSGLKLSCDESRTPVVLMYRPWSPRFFSLTETVTASPGEAYSLASPFTNVMMSRMNVLYIYTQPHLPYDADLPDKHFLNRTNLVFDTEILGIIFSHLKPYNLIGLRLYIDHAFVHSIEGHYGMRAAACAREIVEKHHIAPNTLCYGIVIQPRGAIQTIGSR